MRTNNKPNLHFTQNFVLFKVVNTHTGESRIVSFPRGTMNDPHAGRKMIVKAFDAATGKSNNPASIKFARIDVGAAKLHEITAKRRTPAPVGARLKPEAKQALREGRKSASVLTQWEPEGEWVFNDDCGRKVWQTSSGALLTPGRN